MILFKENTDKEGEERENMILNIVKYSRQTV